VRRGSPAELLIEDHALIHSTNSVLLAGSAGAGSAPLAGSINWEQWRGERVIYRKVAAGQVNWDALPEILAVLEPIVGERLIYNPLAAVVPAASRTEAAGRQRVLSLWQSRYGHPPQAIHSTVSLSYFLASLAQGLREGGNPDEAAALDRLALNRDSTGSPDDILTLLEA